MNGLPNTNPISKISYYVAFGMGFVWFIYIGSNSPFISFHDEVGHFLLSQASLEYPEFLLHIWGRPFNTFIYMFPAQIGFGAARLFSAFMATLVVMITTQVARQLGLKYLFLIPLFLWFQPWFTDIYYTANTMIPLSLLLIGGILLWLHNRYLFASLLFGLLPLTRHEGLALLLAWCIYGIMIRRWGLIFATLTPLVIYNITYYINFNILPSSIFLNLQPTTFYGSGSWLHYLPDIVVGVMPVVLILCCIAIIPIWKSPRIRIIFTPYILYLIIHIIIYRFGLFASGGYGFFLVPLAPGVALAALIGVEYFLKISFKTKFLIFIVYITAQTVFFIWGIFSPLHYLSLVIAASMFIVFKNIIKYFINISIYESRNLALVVAIAASAIITGFIVQPRLEAKNDSYIRQATTWLKTSEFTEPTTQIFSTHPLFYLYYNYKVKPNQLWGDVAVIDTFLSGSIVIWDGHFSDIVGMSQQMLERKPTIWKRIATFGSTNTGNPFVIVYVKI